MYFQSKWLTITLLCRLTFYSQNHKVSLCCPTCQHWAWNPGACMLISSCDKVQLVLVLFVVRQFPGSYKITMSKVKYMPELLLWVQFPHKLLYTHWALPSHCFIEVVLTCTLQSWNVISAYYYDITKTFTPIDCLMINWSARNLWNKILKNGIAWVSTLELGECQSQSAEETGIIEIL